MKRTGRLGRIYEAIAEPIRVEQRELYTISTNNSPAANDLRALLLEVHNDQGLADYIRHSSVKTHLYDPTPSKDYGWVLGWEAEIDKVKFNYQYFDDDKPRFYQKMNFELYQDRFYASGKELIDLFPKLTADALEASLLRHVQKEKDKEKELLLQEKRQRGHL